MSDEKYVLATGEDAEYRLQIVNSVHGEDSENFLWRAGLREGLTVAEIGCGVGVMACWIAEQIGEGGRIRGGNSLLLLLLRPGQTHLNFLTSASHFVTIDRNIPLRSGSYCPSFNGLF